MPMPGAPSPKKQSSKKYRILLFLLMAVLGIFGAVFVFVHPRGSALDTGLASTALAHGAGLNEQALKLQVEQLVKTALEHELALKEQTLQQQVQQLTAENDKLKHALATKEEQAPTIAWAVTVSKDGPIADGAVVLMESIIQAMLGHSKFRHAFVAFVVPEAPRAARMLEQLGWRVLIKPMPLTLESIQGALKEKLMQTGCCGGNELLKLYSYTLPEYHRVVHMDIDMLVLQSMDELFVTDTAMASQLGLQVEALSPQPSLDGLPGGPDAGPIPTGSIGNHSLLYTSDYNMMSKRARHNGVPGAAQGGFLVIQPDLAVFDSIVSIVREGSYGTPRTSGWRNSGIGAWWGGATIQGILPFFYAPIEKKGAIEHESLKYATARELDRCVYDNMVDPSVVDPAPYIGAAACRATPFAKVKAMHFTLCQKPWICRPLQHVNDTQGLCISFHERWHQLRQAAQDRLGIGANQQKLPPYKIHRRGREGADIQPGFVWDISFCSREGVQGYVPIDDKGILSRNSQAPIIIDPKVGLTTGLV